MTVASLGPAVRSGPAHWWHSFATLLRWQLVSMRLVLPVMVVVQMLIAAGIAVGMGLFFTEIDPRAALYLGTGGAIIALIIVGLVVAPQLVADEKESGTYDFTWSLPGPRSAAVAAWVALSAIVSLPAMAVALVVAAWRLDLDYAFTWRLAPAVMLVVVCATMIGYAVGHAIERPTITQVVSQILAFGILGFTPISYPPENLPDWLASVHRMLPFYHMGVIVRDGVSQGLVADVGVSYVAVAGWTVVAMALTALVVGRRK